MVLVNHVLPRGTIWTREPNSNNFPLEGSVYNQYLNVPLFVSSMGATIVDSLDTLYIMGMTEEFEKAKKWVESNLDMSKMVSNGYFSGTVTGEGIFPQRE